MSPTLASPSVSSSTRLTPSGCSPAATCSHPANQPPCRLVEPRASTPRRPPAARSRSAGEAVMPAMATSTSSSYVTTLKRSSASSLWIASTTACFARPSLFWPPIEPERSSTKPRLTGGRRRAGSGVAVGATTSTSRNRSLRPWARMRRRSGRTSRLASTRRPGLRPGLGLVVTMPSFGGSRPDGAVSSGWCRRVSAGVDGRCGGMPRSWFVVEQLARDAEKLLDTLVRPTVQRTPDMELDVRCQDVTLPGGPVADVRAWTGRRRRRRRRERQGRGGRRRLLAHRESVGDQRLERRRGAEMGRSGLGRRVRVDAGPRHEISHERERLRGRRGWRGACIVQRGAQLVVPQPFEPPTDLGERQVLALEALDESEPCEVALAVA